jgi:hypothetical protein
LSRKKWRPLKNYGNVALVANDDFAIAIHGQGKEASHLWQDPNPKVGFQLKVKEDSGWLKRNFKHRNKTSPEISC